MHKLIPLLAILAAGCATEPLTVHGNARGGMIAGDTELDRGDTEVFAVATTHCAKYGKRPLIKSIARGVGRRTALFDCA
jgi:hypothetical protein